MITEFSDILGGLGWALMHSLWQGTLAALILLAFRSSVKSASPALNYMVGLVCLIGSLAAFVITFALYPGNQQAVIISVSLPTDLIFPAVQTVANDPTPLFPAQAIVSGELNRIVPYLGIFWCLGFSLMMVRYIVAYKHTQSLRRIGLSEVPPAWQHRFRTLALNAGLSDRVQLFVSDRINGPMTLGFVKPVVLVPVGFLTGLPYAQVEAILLHEIAHIRRHDYFINLIQTAIKTILFYHPAIHFMSDCMDKDREQACDDLAVAQSGDPRALARGLASLRLSLEPENMALYAHKPATNETGNAHTESALVQRLNRLTGAPKIQHKYEPVMMSVVTLFLIGGIYFSTTALADANASQSTIHSEPPDFVTVKNDNADPAPKAMPAAKPKIIEKKTAEKKIHENKAAHNGYRYEMAEIKGHTIKVKISPSGTRWVKYEGSWYDIDTHADLVDKLPQVTAQQITVRKVSPLTSRSVPRPAKPQTVPIAPIAAPALYKVIEAPLAPLPVSNNALAGGPKAETDYDSEADINLDALETQLDRYIDAIIDAAPDSQMVERAQIEMDKIMRQVERELELTQKTREHIMDRIETESERTMARMQRETERSVKRAAKEAERAMQRAQKEIERAQREAERAKQRSQSGWHDPIDINHQTDHPLDNQDTGQILRTKLLDTLRADGLITSNTQTFKLVHRDGWTELNGTRVPRQVQGHYCKLIDTYVTQGDETVKILLTPKSLDVVSIPTDGQDSTHVTYGTYDHTRKKAGVKNKDVSSKT